MCKKKKELIGVLLGIKEMAEDFLETFDKDMKNRDYEKVAVEAIEVLEDINEMIVKQF
jgi:hypothetical protein